MTVGSASKLTKTVKAVRAEDYVLGCISEYDKTVTDEGFYRCMYSTARPFLWMIQVFALNWLQPHMIVGFVCRTNYRGFAAA